MLRAAAAAPDHGRMRPTRFIVLRGDAKSEFGEVLHRAYLARCDRLGVEVEPARAEKERTKLGRAPLVVVVVNLAPDPTHPKFAKIPRSEQRDSSAASAQNLLLAATAMGYGSIWRSGEIVRDPMVIKALGLQIGDEPVGFVYLGSIPEGMRPEPNDPSMDGLVSDWRPTAAPE